MFLNIVFKSQGDCYKLDAENPEYINFNDHYSDINSNLGLSGNQINLLKDDLL